MEKDYKIAVLGPIPRDHITTYEGLEISKYGCVLYPVVALSRLVSSNSRIIPVTHLRKIDEAPVKALLAPFQNVDTDHITSEADQGDVISLVYVDQNKRLERQTAFMNPIVPRDVENLLDSDAFVFVPVTDFEVALDTLQYLKKNSKGVIIFDAHGPTNTCSRLGERVHRFWIDRDLWLPHIDILKMNLEEAGCSWYQKEYEPEDLEEITELSLDELPKFASHCLNHGVKAVYITLDEYGCAVYFKDKDGKVQEHFVKRCRVEQVVDTTGCGDSFAGGLAFGLLKTGDYVQACQYGNAMGAQRCVGTELAIYKSLTETEQQIIETYGPSK
ncbi:MAG: sugar/nucleoside kinase (ribokinase family) [Polaribacter sp.]|jgi:sugar/nucleoside kinase (ribokinase family)